MVCDIGIFCRIIDVLGIIGGSPLRVVLVINVIVCHLDVPYAAPVVVDIVFVWIPQANKCFFLSGSARAIIVEHVAAAFAVCAEFQIVVRYIHTAFAALVASRYFDF